MYNNCRKEFIVLFSKSEHWTRRFLNKDISHVTVAALQGKTWIKADPTPIGLNLMATLYNDETLSIIRKRNDLIGLRVVVYRTKSYFAKIGLMTCTDVAQYILGIHYKYCFTPNQLYKRLINNKYDYISVKRV